MLRVFKWTMRGQIMHLDKGWEKFKIEGCWEKRSKPSSHKMKSLSETNVDLTDVSPKKQSLKHKKIISWCKAWLAAVDKSKSNMSWKSKEEGEKITCGQALWTCAENEWVNEYVPLTMTYILELFNQVKKWQIWNRQRLIKSIDRKIMGKKEQTREPDLPPGQVHKDVGKIPE